MPCSPSLAHCGARAPPFIEAGQVAGDRGRNVIAARGRRPSSRRHVGDVDGRAEQADCGARAPPFVEALWSLPPPCPPGLAIAARARRPSSRLPDVAAALQHVVDRGAGARRPSSGYANLEYHGKTHGSRRAGAPPFIKAGRWTTRPGRPSCRGARARRPSLRPLHCVPAAEHPRGDRGARARRPSSRHLHPRQAPGATDLAACMRRPSSRLDYWPGVHDVVLDRGAHGCRPSSRHAPQDVGRGDLPYRGAPARRPSSRLVLNRSAESLPAVAARVRAALHQGLFLPLWNQVKCSSRRS